MIKVLLLIVSPARTWERIAQANRGLLATLFLFLVPLLALTTAAESYALMKVGYQRGHFEQITFASENLAVRYGVTQMAAELLVVFVGALLIQWIAASTDHRRNYSRYFIAVAYGLGPLFMTHLLDCIPALNTWLCWSIGIALSASVLYMAVPQVLQPDQTKAFGIYFMSVMALTVLTALAHLVVVSVLTGGVWQ